MSAERDLELVRSLVGAALSSLETSRDRIDDLNVVVEYGLNLAEVASSVSNRVAYEVHRLTGLPVRAVEVHVDDVRTGGK